MVVGMVIEKVPGVDGGGGKSFKKLGESGSMSDRRYSSLIVVSILYRISPIRDILVRLRKKDSLE